MHTKSPVPTSSLTLQGAGIPAGRMGVFALSSGSIKLVDGKTFAMYGPFLGGQLGSWLLDVVLSKNGKTGLLSNFTNTVYFLDFANPVNPKVRGAVALSLTAEDIALAPTEKFALVTDGSPGPKIASLDVKKRRLVQEFDLTPYSASAQAVAIAKDNKTVITADYYGKAINHLLMNPSTGTLTYGGAISVAPASPINVVISPNGKTAFIVSFLVNAANQGFGPVFSIPMPGSVVFTNWLTPISRYRDFAIGRLLQGQQEALCSRDVVP